MTTNEFERLEHELEEAYAMEAPDLRFAGIAGRRETATTGTPLRWKVGGALAVLVLAAVGGFVVFPGVGDRQQTANAKALIERSISASEAMSANPPRYHLIAVSRTSTSVVTTESWFSDAEHFRNETKSQGADGQTWLEGTAMLGDEFWLWQGSPSQLRAAYGPTSLHIVGIPGIPTLAEHIRAWTQDNCFSADLEGTSVVAGRRAQRVVVRSTPATCPYQPKPLTQSTLWLDVETSMALRVVSEGVDAEHSSTYEVTTFETFDALPDSTFVFSAPPGTTITSIETPEQFKQAFIPIVPKGSKVVIDAEP